MNDKTPLRELKGVGEKTEKLFQKIGITTAEELLRYYPRTYDIYEEPVEIASAEEDKTVSIRATIATGSRSQRESCCRILWQQWREL
mgnify:CR=1 FL=1